MDLRGSSLGSTYDLPAELSACRRVISTSVAGTIGSGTMPADNGLRFDDRRCVHHAGYDPIQAGEYPTIEITEREMLRCPPVAAC
jgi:hypothetical protein